MASLPYPLNRLVYSYCQSGCHTHSIGLCTHVVSLVAIPIQSACVLMLSIWLPPLNWLVYSCMCGYGRDAIPSYRYPFFCFPQKPVLLFFCLSQKPCSHVLLSFPNKPVLMFFCLSPKQPCSPSPHVFMSPKKTAESNAPSR